MTRFKNILVSLLKRDATEKFNDNSNVIEQQILSGLVTDRCRCANCLSECSQDELDTIDDIGMRIDPGSVVPAGQCVHCGCLSYLMSKKTPYQDTIIDSLAIWEEIYCNDQYLDSLTKSAGEGIWAAREAVASKVMPAVRKYYATYGSDVDFDGVFIAPLLNAMHNQCWNMEYSYDAVCQKTRDEWLGETT